MKAIRYHGYGSHDVLALEEVPDPVPGPGEVVVDLCAAGINHLDIWVREGVYGDRLKLPHIPGSDGAGVVTGIGPGVTDVAVGEEVVISPGLSCGTCEMCLKGEDNFCPSYVILGAGPDGTYAERVAVPRQNLLPKPAGLSFAEAASLPLVLVTAWHMLHTLAGVRQGETVLVLGGTSGVGSAAIQVARLAGATVIATASTAKLDRLRSLGPDHVIDHATEDIRRKVGEITERRGVDVVFEHVGKATWDASLKSLRPGGRLVTCGSTSGYDAVTDLRYLYQRQLRIMGDYMGTKGELLEAWRLVAAGHLRPFVDRTFPLDQAGDAHAYVEGRRAAGKVVLTIGPEH